MNVFLSAEGCQNFAGGKVQLCSHNLVPTLTHILPPAVCEKKVAGVFGAKLWSIPAQLPGHFWRWERGGGGSDSGSPQ